MRKREDSNPWSRFAGLRFSRPSHSTTLARFHGYKPSKKLVRDMPSLSTTQSPLLNKTKKQKNNKAIRRTLSRRRHAILRDEGGESGIRTHGPFYRSTH